ncbi:MAG: hypothetical protein L0K48_07615, partial [Bifidobacterium mongoliense]|nr:hypothetical protein [Bifidobacterium mongoliense]
MPPSDQIRVGRSDSGVPYLLNLGHTLVVGATGSGKGSVRWAYIMGAMEATHGKLLLYGWDPKRAELAGVTGRFARVAFDNEDGLDLLRELV